jgi:heme/copper-type cytochrome/quinol oxidase subunit 1
MRRGLLLGAVLGIVNTAVVLLISWMFRPPTTYGFYSYSPMPKRYSDYLPPSHQVTGWASIALVAGVLVAVNIALGAVYVAIRQLRRRRRAPTGSAGAA